MIRLTLLYAFSFGVAVYAWRDWYKSLCGLILLMAVLEHPDMPKAMLGIQGLNVWNTLCACILLSWAVHRGEEGQSWDMPRHITILLLLYLSVVLVGFSRMMSDQGFRETIPAGTLVGEYLVNTLKWVVPGLLLFDGCRSRSRFLLALGSLLAVYFLLGVQVIRWIPPGAAISGEELSARSLKLLVNEVGYHRVNLSMMLAGASWAVLATLPLVGQGKYRILAVAVFLSLVYAQALTGGRMGYATWAVVGVTLAFIRWRKILLLVPLVILAIPVVVPGVAERLMQGFSPASSTKRRPGIQDYNPGGPDLYTITAIEASSWHFVVSKSRSPHWWVRPGHGKNRSHQILWEEYQNRSRTAQCLSGDAPRQWMVGDPPRSPVLHRHPEARRFPLP
jgi:hypothetical protein